MKFEAGGLVVLAPHPDDEVLGAGGIIARASASGVPVRIVLLTDGSASHPQAEGLVQRRLDEARAGLGELGVGEAALIALGHRDGALDAARCDLGSLRKAVPRDATLLVTDPTDAHPDHRAAFGVAARLIGEGHGAALWTMPVSQRVDGRFAPSPRWQALPVGEARDAKARAIAAHVSQTSDPSGFVLPEAAVAEFLDVEYVTPVVLPDNRGAVDAAHFDAMFAADPDPWGYDREAYEADRFDRTLAALGPRSGRLFEAGAAAGALTERLAQVAAEVVAVEASREAIAHARRRVGHLSNVTLIEGALPGATPEGPFDTLLLSDMLYYLGLHGVIEVARRCDAIATEDARIVATIYLGETECALSGDMAAEALIAHLPGWRRIEATRTDRLRIDVLTR